MIRPFLGMLLLLPGAAGDPPEIRVEKSAEWKADRGTVKRVLSAAAGELWKHVSEGKPPVIQVWPKGGPILLYRRGPAGEFLVKLDTGESYWAQYTYQFAHECAHVLAGGAPAKHRHKWFEESLCEAASLFVLRRSAETWKTSPPYPGGESFAPALRNYADDRMKKGLLPEGKTLAAWYAENREALEAKADDRARNQVPAQELLPLLEKEPERWESLLWLNAEPLPAEAPFARVLEAWKARCPERHRAFVGELALRFGLE